MNGWETHQLLVLAELKRLSEIQDKTLETLQELRIDFERLKTSSNLKFGILSVGISAMVSLAIKLI
jgi:hypothetical protein